MLSGKAIGRIESLRFDAKKCLNAKYTRTPRICTFTTHLIGIPSKFYSVSEMRKSTEKLRDECYKFNTECQENIYDMLHSDICRGDGNMMCHLPSIHNNNLVCHKIIRAHMRRKSWLSAI